LSQKSGYGKYTTAGHFTKGDFINEISEIHLATELRSHFSLFLSEKFS